MFGGGMLGFLALLLVLSIIAREGSLFLLALALLVAAGLSRLWERHCLTGVEYRRHFDRAHATVGETLELEIEIRNRKILPLSWIELEDEVPRRFRPSQGRGYVSHKPDRYLMRSLLALRPYERVRRHYTIPCQTRGEHVFGPAYLRSGDLFGFAGRSETRELIETFVVCPRVVPVSELGLPARQPVGELRVQSWIFEDVSRTAGARDYRPVDGQRRIHWPASVRAQGLQSRVYEATTSHRLAVFLNVDAEEDPDWGRYYDPDVLEFSIVTAASLAAWGLERGYQVGLSTNGMHRWSWGNVRVEPGQSPSQLEHILIALGRLLPFGLRTFAQIISEESARLAFGTTVVLVSAGLSDASIDAARGLRARGHAVTVVLTGWKGDVTGLDGIAVRRAGPPDEWRDLTTIAATSESNMAGAGG